MFLHVSSSLIIFIKNHKSLQFEVQVQSHISFLIVIQVSFHIFKVTHWSGCFTLTLAGPGVSLLHVAEKFEEKMHEKKR